MNFKRNCPYYSSWAREREKAFSKEEKVDAENADSAEPPRFQVPVGLSPCLLPPHRASLPSIALWPWSATLLNVASHLRDFPLLDLASHPCYLPHNRLGELFVFTVSSCPFSPPGPCPPRLSYCCPNPDHSELSLQCVVTMHFLLCILKGKNVNSSAAENVLFSPVSPRPIRVLHTR